MEQVLALGDTLFSAEFLGRREASVVSGARGFCFLIASLRARVKFGFNSLADMCPSHRLRSTGTEAVTEGDSLTRQDASSAGISG